MHEPNAVRDAGERFFEFLVRAYPLRFRQRYGEQLLDFFRYERGSRRFSAGFSGRFWFWIGTLADLFTSVCRQRVDQFFEFLFRRGRSGSAGRSPLRKELMSKFVQDLRFAVRTLSKVPAFTFIAVLTLGLGIGANTTIFAAVDVFMLRPLPYPDSDQVGVIYTSVPERGWTQNVSIPDYLDLKQRSSTLQLALYDSWGYNLGGEQSPERVSGMKVSSDLLPMLGYEPELGRFFTPDEDFSAVPASVIISHELWQRRYGGSRDILGKTAFVDGNPHEIVGVLPEDYWFRGREQDILTPLDRTAFDDRSWRGYVVVSRLAPGAELETARSELAAISAALAEANPETNVGREFELRTMHADIFDEGFVVGSRVSSLAVLFVLLIACANVANLILARAAGRTREIALRTALGAGRWRIVSQLLTESLILALAGGVAGLTFGFGGIRALASVMPPDFPRATEIALDGRAVIFTLIASAVTALVFGLLPALHSSRPNLTESLKEGGRSVANRGGRLRQALVVSEVALALVLVISSTLLVKGFLRLQASDFGFATENVLALRFDLPENTYPDDERIYGFYEQSLETLAAVPGVLDVGMVHRLPRTGNSSVYYTVGDDERTGNDRPIVTTRWIGGDYFAALEVPLIAGRTFDATDTPESPGTVVINEMMARRHWPGEDPVGQIINFTSGPAQVVGVVGNFADVDQDVRPMVFLSNTQSTLRFMSILARTSVPPMSVAGTMLDRMEEIDPNLPMFGVQTLASFIDENAAGNRVMPQVMGVLAGIALALALIGVYGVMSYSVAQRTSEIGVRMALGASRNAVVRLIVNRALLLAGLGVGVGLALAAATTRTMSFFLFGVSPYDLTTFAAVSAVLMFAGLLASAMPAHRAARVDPMQALRTE